MSLPFSLEAVEAAQISFDEEDRAIVAGSVVTSLGFTAASVGMLAPREWEDVADYLYGLIAREPLAHSRAYAAHRIVLGNLASELRGYAFAADRRPEPIDPAIFSDYIDDVISRHQEERASLVQGPTKAPVVHDMS